VEGTCKRKRRISKNRGGNKKKNSIEARKSKEGEKGTVAADKGVGAENNNSSG
jgi:hypothetical protein